MPASKPFNELREKMAPEAQARAAERTAGMLAEPDGLRALLYELVTLVRGECPSLLSEDSGGDARLSMAIDVALAVHGAAEAERSATDRLRTRACFHTGPHRTGCYECAYAVVAELAAEIGSLQSTIEGNGQARMQLMRMLEEAEGRSQPTEVCICAAIRLDDGELFRGHRHDDAIHTAGKAGVERKRLYSAEQGFITSRNRFVGREEGAELQIAASIPSAHTGKPPLHVLFSEDLYMRATKGQMLPPRVAGSEEGS